MTGVWLLMAAGCLGQTGKEGGSKRLPSTPRGVSVIEQEEISLKHSHGQIESLWVRIKILRQQREPHGWSLLQLVSSREAHW